MGLKEWVIGKKAQVIYSIIVLIFNGVAVYYLFFFSNAPINLSFLIPNGSVFKEALEKPFMTVMSKLSFTEPIKKRLPSQMKIVTVTTTPSPTQVASQGAVLINCIGPDGKQLFLSQEDCDNFNNAWKVATISATPTAPLASGSAQAN